MCKPQIIELNNLIQTVIHFRASQRVTFAIKRFSSRTNIYGNNSHSESSIKTLVYTVYSNYILYVIIILYPVQRLVIMTLNFIIYDETISFVKCHKMNYVELIV